MFLDEQGRSKTGDGDTSVLGDVPEVQETVDLEDPKDSVWEG